MIKTLNIWSVLYGITSGIDTYVSLYYVGTPNGSITKYNDFIMLIVATISGSKFLVSH